MKHYTSDELDCYRTNRMMLFPRLLCRCHLFSCADCRQRLHELRADDDLLAELQRSLKRMNVPQNEDTFRALCQKLHNG